MDMCLEGNQQQNLFPFVQLNWRRNRRRPGRYITGSVINHQQKKNIYIMYIYIYIYIYTSYLYILIKKTLSCACLCFLLSASFCFSLPRLGQETSDVAEMEETGTEKAGKVLLVCFVGFLEKMFFFQAHACQEENPNRAIQFAIQGVIVLVNLWPWNLECCWNAVFACL